MVLAQVSLYPASSLSHWAHTLRIQYLQLQWGLFITFADSDGGTNLKWLAKQEGTKPAMAKIPW